MNLQNGYKVIFEKAADGKRAFFASKTGLFADAEQIGEEFEIGQYKLIYEKGGRFYGSESGIPADGDHCFDAFDKVFVAAEDAAEPEQANDVEEESAVEKQEEVPADVVADDEEPEVITDEDEIDE
jgi:hypothetical protein